MDANKFKKDLQAYKLGLSDNLDDETVNLMLHAFCMGYCQLSNELNEEFGAYIDLNPVFDTINKLNPLIKSAFDKDFKKMLYTKIYNSIEKELKRQVSEGKEFLKDSEIDSLVEEALREELDNNE